MDEQFVISCLEAALKNNSIHNYKIFGEADWCIGLDRNDDGWETYSVDRGQRFSVVTFGTLYDACINLITRVSDEENKKIKTMQDFINKILSDSSSKVM